MCRIAFLSYSKLPAAENMESIAVLRGKFDVNISAMKKCTLSFIAFFLLFTPAFAQLWNWSKTISFALPGYVNELASDQGGNFYLNALDSASAVSCVVKYNSAGNEVWRKYFPGISIQTFSAQSNYLYITGNFEGTINIDTALLTSRGNSDIFLACLTSAGNFLWAKSMGGRGNDLVEGIATDNQNYIYLTGNFQDSAYFDAFVANGTTQPAMFVARLNSHGIITMLKFGEPTSYGPSFGKWIQ